MTPEVFKLNYNKDNYLNTFFITGCKIDEAVISIKDE